MPVWLPIAIGAACLLAAVLAYFRDTARAVFPIVMALVGVFLCGAQVVRFVFPEGGSVELSRQVVETTKQASATVDATSVAIAQQNTVLQQLGTRVDTLQSAIQTLQGEFNQRLAQNDVPPVQLPQTDALNASKLSLGAALRSSVLAHRKLTIENDALRSAVQALPSP